MAALSPAEPTLAYQSSEPVCGEDGSEGSSAELGWLPLSECSMQPATSPRRATVISTAATTRRAFICESMAQPTTRFENTSLIAQT